MKAELQKQLYEKYPKIFRQKDLPMHQTCMCWGIECGDGWYNVIDTLCGMIQWRIDQKNKEVARNKWYQRKLRNGKIDQIPEWWLNKFRKHGVLTFEKEDITRFPQTEAAQVKEKFGALRFYTSGGYDDTIGGYIDFAEAMTARTCDVCGAPGKRGGTGWIVTRCEKHANTRCQPEDE